MLDDLLFPIVEAKLAGFSIDDGFQSQTEYEQELGKEGLKELLIRFGVSKKIYSLFRPNQNFLGLQWKQTDAQPKNDLGDRLEQEFNKRPLTFREQKISFLYFHDDFERSMLHAHNYLDLAERHAEQEQVQNKFLEQAYACSERATKDLQIARRIVPMIQKYGIAMVFEGLYAEQEAQLRDIKARLYDVLENPMTFGLRRQLKIAVQNEQYETASTIRDQIKETLAA